MKIVIVGLGYVGVTAAACISRQGHSVVGVDTNEQKVESINSGRAPITEPMVDEMIASAVHAGQLAASTHLPSLHDTDMVIVCVGTPSASDGSHNMGFIAESARQIAASVVTRNSGKDPIAVTFRSTFRPGTMESLIGPIFAEALGDSYADRVELIYNPEFLRESTAVSDYFAPPKIVIGTRNGELSQVMAELNSGIEAPTFYVPFREAEVTKFIDNTWHAVKVAFANEIGRVCSAHEVDADLAHAIFVSDTKLNISPYYTRPGGAFGGSCLPKDVRAMQFISRSAGVRTELIDSLLQSNDSHKAFQLDRVLSRVGGDSRILVAGLAFKAGTDDMRESPNVDLVSELLRRGHVVNVFDPEIQTSSLVGQNLGYVLTAIPNLREILVDGDTASRRDYDLVVINNATGEALPPIDAQVLDLRRVSSRNTVDGSSM